MEKLKKNTPNNSTLNAKTQRSLTAVLEGNKKLPEESVNNAVKMTVGAPQNLLTPISTPSGSGVGGLKIPTDILDDLSSRFIINIPDREREDMIRVCFQVELALWFYTDFMLPTNNNKTATNEIAKKLPACGIKQFAAQIFNHVAFLRPHQALVDNILEEWKQYKISVPTYGAILISAAENGDYQVLLVQSFWSKCSFGFPKGKINENEDQVHCAIREVYEETGYDITKLISENEYIELVINLQYTRLYLVWDVPQKTIFEPKTRNEIKSCRWFSIDSLPTNKNESKLYNGMNANSFFMIFPFIKRLKRYLADKKAGIESVDRLKLAMTRSSPKTFSYNTPDNATVGRQRNKGQSEMTSSTPLASAISSSNSKARFGNKSSAVKSPHLDVSISSILDVSLSGRGQKSGNTFTSSTKMNKIKRKLSYDAVGSEAVAMNSSKNPSKNKSKPNVISKQFEFSQKVTNMMGNFQFDRPAIILAMQG